MGELGGEGAFVAVRWLSRETCCMTKRSPLLSANERSSKQSRFHAFILL